jgi:hypothetical protein
MEKNNSLKVTVKSGSKELSIEIPLTPRSEVGMDSNGTGKRALDIVSKLIDEIKKLES